MAIVRGVSWELTLAPFWEAQTDAECETIFKPEGVGAIQLSSARKEGEVTDADLVEFASNHLKAGTKTQPVTLGEFSGIAIEYQADESHWRLWFLSHGSVALFITYNCSIEDRGAEDNEVAQMLHSLRNKSKAV